MNVFVPGTTSTRYDRASLPVRGRSPGWRPYTLTASLCACSAISRATALHSRPTSPPGEYSTRLISDGYVLPILGPQRSEVPGTDKRQNPLIHVNFGLLTRIQSEKRDDSPHFDSRHQNTPTVTVNWCPAQPPSLYCVSAPTVIRSHLLNSDTSSACHCPNHPKYSADASA